ncbi:MAG TPA: Uma2 family endonuclease, partial [Polyangiaceae bacterium]
FDRYSKDGYVTDLEFEFQRKDGTVFPVIVNSTAVFIDARAALSPTAMARLPYVPNPIDPRAPSEATWQSMTEAERATLLALLPSELRATEPEGDFHRDPKVKAVEALREYFRRKGRRVYLSSELPVFYPQERVFAPDVIAVLDVDPRPRNSWVVSHEGQGIDFALEVTLMADRSRDLEDNVVRYARLGIREYFVLDLKLRRVLGYRLDASGNYELILPQSGRLASHVLGLSLAFELDRVRFFAGSAPLPFADEMIARLDTIVGELVSKERSLEQRLEIMTALAEQAKAIADNQKAVADCEHAKVDRLIARLRELGIDPDSD